MFEEVCRSPAVVSWNLSLLEHIGKCSDLTVIKALECKDSQLHNSGIDTVIRHVKKSCKAEESYERKQGHGKHETKLCYGISEYV